MTELDREKGREVAEGLKKLGVSGILISAAEQGYITELACGMPKCYCPEEMGGRTYFEPVSQPMPDWAPNHEHFPTAKRDGGHRTVDNSVIGHVLCNRIDYSIAVGRPHQKDLDRVEKARQEALARLKLSRGSQGPSGPRHRSVP